MYNLGTVYSKGSGWHGTLITGKRDETGLMYRRARYYDPATGRFTQEDPIGLAGGLNLYGYAAGDPVNFVDPSGNLPIPVITGGIGAVAGAVVGTGVYLATTPRSQWSLGGGLTYAGGGFVAGGVAGATFGAVAPGLSASGITALGLGRLLPGAAAASGIGEITVITQASTMGKLIGWGTGQSATAVATTEAVTQSLTRESVRQLAARGLTREWVEAQLEFYTRSLAQGGAKLRNVQLLPRYRLMKRILDLWPD